MFPPVPKVAHVLCFTGLQMLLHTGTSFGYGALLTLLPDVNLGIHTSHSGPDEDYERKIQSYLPNILFCAPFSLLYMLQWKSFSAMQIVTKALG